MFLVCGEALFDFFLESEAGPAAATYAARAGGSPFNVAIGLARLGAGLGAADRALERPARASGWRRCWRTRASRPPMRSRPTGRPRSAWSGSMPPGCRPTSSTRTARPIPAWPRPTCRRSGRRSRAALRLLLARRDAGRRRLGGAGARQPRPVHLARSQRAADGRARHGRLARAAGGAVPARRPGQDQRRGPRRCCAPARAAEAVRRGPHRRRASRSSWSPTAARRRWAGPPAGFMRRRCRRRSTVVDTVGAGDTFQAALIARLLRDRAGPKAALAGARRRHGLRRLLDYAARAAAITCSRRGADLPRAAELTD